MKADSNLCADLRADPHIVEAWITGWTLARDTPPPVPDSGGFRVDVGWPQQKVRYVFPDLSEGLRRLASSIVDPWIFLKACASPEAMRDVLPSRWALQPLRIMMTCSGPLRADEAVLPEGYTLDLTEHRSVSTTTVRTANDEVAAIGHVVTVGGFAIYDQIETHADHRRRGLGRAVMKALERIARAQGAIQGVLVATNEGRALYETLGWRAHSPYTTAVIPPSSPMSSPLHNPSVKLDAL